MSIQHPEAHEDTIGYGPWWFSVAEIKVIKTEGF